MLLWFEVVLYASLYLNMFVKNKISKYFHFDWKFISLHIFFIFSYPYFSLNKVGKHAMQEKMYLWTCRRQTEKYIFKQYCFCFSKFRNSSSKGTYTDCRYRSSDLSILFLYYYVSCLQNSQRFLSQILS